MEAFVANTLGRFDVFVALFCRSLSRVLTPVFWVAVVYLVSRVREQYRSVPSRQVCFFHVFVGLFYRSLSRVLNPVL